MKESSQELKFKELIRSKDKRIHNLQRQVKIIEQKQTDQFKTLQRSMAKKDIELKKISKLKNELASCEERIKSLAQKIIFKDKELENIYQTINRLYGESAVSRVKFYVKDLIS